MRKPPSLAAVPSTLCIPLAARALGKTIFPAIAIEDKHAAKALEYMGDDGQRWLQDRQSVYGVLARTALFRDQARDFVTTHPSAHIVNLGCGLSDYLQWFDNGNIRMTDADLPEVIAIRKTIMPPKHTRHTLTELDLTASDWWQQLGLPESQHAEPVHLISEGVFMYLKPAVINNILKTFGERAPEGSILTFDAMCWLSIGRAKQHTSVKHTEAQFYWGPRKLSDITAAHPRLKLIAAHQVMANYHWFYRLFQPIFKAVTGVPLYAVYTITTTAGSD